MKNSRLFLTVAAGTACLCLAGRFVDADEKDAAKLPVPTGSTAIINDCEVTGRFVRKEDGVYVVLTLTNPSDGEAAVDFNYAATCLPGSALMSRMIRLPDEVKRDACAQLVKAGMVETREVLLRATAGESRSEIPAPDAWTLTISRGEVDAKAGWGALAPAALGQKVVLEKGQLVLATWQDAVVTAGPRES